MEAGAAAKLLIRAAADVGDGGWVTSAFVGGGGGGGAGAFFLQAVTDNINTAANTAALSVLMLFRIS